MDTFESLIAEALELVEKAEAMVPEGEDSSRRLRLAQATGALQTLLWGDDD
jgi:hypothetical protein